MSASPDIELLPPHVAAKSIFQVDTSQPVLHLRSGRELGENPRRDAIAGRLHTPDLSVEAKDIFEVGLTDGTAGSRKDNQFHRE